MPLFKPEIAGAPRSFYHYCQKDNWNENESGIDDLQRFILKDVAVRYYHPKATVFFQVLEGESQYGGTMPGFMHKLTSTDAEAAIVFFQSKWSDSVFQQWEGRNE